MINIGILVSGNGTNMEAILKASENGILENRINPVVIISNNREAKAIEKARKYKSIVEFIIERETYKSAQTYDKAVCDTLKLYEVDLVVLAGYNRLIKNYSHPDCILRSFSKRIVNIHPSLLPAFPGMGAIKQALDYGVKITGCTIHWVDAGMDTGKIIKQKSCIIEPEDTLETLTNRVHKSEHSLYVEALRNVYFLMKRPKYDKY